MRLIRGKLVCECKEDIYFVIPCRHQLAVYTKTKFALNYLPFNKRWLTSFYKDELPQDPNNLEEIEDSLDNEDVLIFPLI